MPLKDNRLGGSILTKILSEDKLSVDITISVAKQDIIDNMTEIQNRMDADNAALERITAEVADLQSQLDDLQSQLDLFPPEG